MCLVGGANKDSSGLDVRWEKEYWGNVHLCYWQRDWIKTAPGVWTVQHIVEQSRCMDYTVGCRVLGESKPLPSSLIFKSPAQVSYFNLHAERSRKGGVNIQFCSELGWPVEKEMAAHCSILAWIIPRTEEPARLQSTGSQESDTT